MTSITVSVYSTVEDDGWVEVDDDSQGEISSQEELEEAYEGSQWEDDVGPNEFEEATNSNDNDDDSNNDDNDSDTNDDLPLCRWGEKQDCKVKNGMVCKVDERADPCMDIWGGFSGESNAEFSKRVGKIVESSTYPSNNDPSSNSDNDQNSKPKDPSPYCSTPAAENSKSCWDVKDVDQVSGKYPCNDGTQKADWKDCVDVSNEAKNFCKNNPLADGCHENDHTYIEKIKACHDLPFYMSCESQKKKSDDKQDEKNNVIQKTTVVQSASASASSIAAASNEADISNCKLDGSADGIQQKFNQVRYQACGLYTYADKAYYDGFVAGCMEVGNTKLICETVANSNIVTPQTQKQTQTTTQPAQAIQPATVS